MSRRKGDDRRLTLLARQAASISAVASAAERLPSSITRNMPAIQARRSGDRGWQLTSKTSIARRARATIVAVSRCRQARKARRRQKPAATYRTGPSREGCGDRVEPGAQSSWLNSISTPRSVGSTPPHSTASTVAPASLLGERRQQRRLAVLTSRGGQKMAGELLASACRRVASSTRRPTRRPHALRDMRSPSRRHYRVFLLHGVRSGEPAAHVSMRLLSALVTVCCIDSPVLK